jgi:lipid-A-disaccharide synthase-like uncharacterized protein
MEALFVSLYPLVTILHILAYFPQIKALSSSNADVTVIPAVTWFIWLGTNILSLGYNFFHIQDRMLCLTTGLSTILMCTVLGLILYHRRRQILALQAAAPVL